MEEHTHTRAEKEIQFPLMSCGFMCISFRFNQTFTAHIGKCTQWNDESHIVRQAQGSTRFISSRCCCLTCVANINVSHDVSVFTKGCGAKMMCKLKLKLKVRISQPFILNWLCNPWQILFDALIFPIKFIFNICAFHLVFLVPLGFAQRWYVIDNAHTQHRIYGEINGWKREDFGLNLILELCQTNKPNNVRV